MIGYELYPEIRTEDIPDSYPEHDEAYGYHHLVLYDSTITKIGRLTLPDATADDILNDGKGPALWSLEDTPSQLPRKDLLEVFTEVTRKHYRTKFGTDCINMLDHYGMIEHIPQNDTWIRPQARFQTPTGLSYVATVGSRALEFAIGKFPAGIYLDDEEVAAYRNKIMPVRQGEIICYDQHALVRSPQTSADNTRYPYVLLSASYDMPQRVH